MGCRQSSALRDGNCCTCSAAEEDSPRPSAPLNTALETQREPSTVFHPVSDPPRLLISPVSTVSDGVVAGLELEDVQTPIGEDDRCEDFGGGLCDSEHHPLDETVPAVLDTTLPATCASEASDASAVRKLQSAPLWYPAYRAMPAPPFSLDGHRLEDRIQERALSDTLIGYCFMLSDASERPPPHVPKAPPVHTLHTRRGSKVRIAFPVVSYEAPTFPSPHSAHFEGSTSTQMSAFTRRAAQYVVGSPTTDEPTCVQFDDSAYSTVSGGSPVTPDDFRGGSRLLG